MAALFSSEYSWLWAVALGFALFLPVRQLIWVLSVRRAERRDGATDEATRARLRRRASVTAGLLVFVFAVFYANHLFRDGR